LVVALHDLYLRAGRPGLRVLARAAAADDECVDTISHEGVSALLQGRGVPRWTKVQSLTLVLAKRAVDQPDLRVAMLNIHELWSLAAESAASPSNEADVAADASLRDEGFQAEAAARTRPGPSAGPESASEDFEVEVPSGWDWRHINAMELVIEFLNGPGVLEVIYALEDGALPIRALEHKAITIAIDLDIPGREVPTPAQVTTAVAEMLGFVVEAGRGPRSRRTSYSLTPVGRELSNALKESGTAIAPYIPALEQALESE